MFAMDHTLDFVLPSLLAVTGTWEWGRGTGEAPGSRREELGESLGKVKYSGVPLTSEARLSEPRFPHA